MKTIAVANQKGGVGKTTTALNLAAGLRERGKRVLVVDLDPQGNLTKYVGHEPDGLPTVSELLSGVVGGGAPDISQAIRTNNEGLAYIPSNILLSSADFFLVNAMMREKVLKRVLDAPAVREYDYTLIDCLPSLGILLINALSASDSVIIPVQAQDFALDGLDAFLSVFQSVREGPNPGLYIEGVLATMCDNTRMSGAVVESLRQRFDSLFYDTYIGRSVEATNSTYARRSLVSSPKSRLGAQYRALAEEFLTKEGSSR